MPRVVPVGELGPDDAGVRAEQLGHQDAHRRGSRRDVVVTDEEETVVALDQSQHLVGARPEPAGDRHLADERRPAARAGYGAVVSAISSAGAGVSRNSVRKLG